MMKVKFTLLYTQPRPISTKLRVRVVHVPLHTRFSSLSIKVATVLIRLKS